MYPDAYFLALAKWLLSQPMTADPQELAEQMQDFEDGYFARPEAFTKDTE